MKKVAANRWTERASALVIGVTLTVICSAPLSGAKLASFPQPNGESTGHLAVSDDGNLVAFSSSASNLTRADTGLCERTSQAETDPGPTTFLMQCNDVFLRDVGRKKTTLVSVSSAGTPGNGDSDNVAMSGDGRTVAFDSGASNLVSGDTEECFIPNEVRGFGDLVFNCKDVFVRDRQRGTTERVSPPPGSDPGSSRLVWFSRNGRHVAFCYRPSYSRDTRSRPTEGPEALYLRDRIRQTTERVLDSCSASFSEDLRYIAFNSYDPGAVLGETRDCSLQGDCQDIFTIDRNTGDRLLVSQGLRGTAADGAAFGTPAISEDGRIIAWWSEAENLVAHDKNEQPDVFVWDRRDRTTELVSISLRGRSGRGSSSDPVLSADGGLVVFGSDASDLVKGDRAVVIQRFGDGTVERANLNDVFVRDRRRGITERVSVSSSGAQGTSGSEITLGDRTAVSPDGRFVAFHSAAPNLAPGLTERSSSQVFLRDRRKGTTILVSAAEFDAPIPDAERVEGPIQSKRDAPALTLATLIAGITIVLIVSRARRRQLPSLRR